MTFIHPVGFVALIVHWNLPISFASFFFFNDPATTEIYTLSLHDALPICHRHVSRLRAGREPARRLQPRRRRAGSDRKSTRLNSSHTVISYAVFCLKKKNNVKYLDPTSKRAWNRV